MVRCRREAAATRAPGGVEEDLEAAFGTVEGWISEASTSAADAMNALTTIRQELERLRDERDEAQAHAFDLESGEAHYRLQREAREATTRAEHAEARAAGLEGENAALEVMYEEEQARAEQAEEDHA